jgi:type II secretory pathway pseudopilin PulG
VRPAPGQPITSPNWFGQAGQVDQGVPGAAAPMTKLGKLLYMLKGMGTGAIIGSGQPTLSSGFQAAQQQDQQQQAFNTQQQQARLGVEQARQNMSMIQTPYGNMPLSLARAILAKSIPASIAGESRENVADTAADSRRDVADTQAASRAKIAQFNANSREKIAGVQGVEVTPEFAQQYNIPKEYVGTKIKLTDLSAFKRSSVFEDVPLQTASGPIIVNRKTGQARPVTGPQGETYQPPALASPKEIADVDNPGQTKIVPAGQSFGQPGTGSASLQVPRQAAKAEVPKDIGTQRIAFTTMAQHADLLRTAMQALNNHDMQTLNRIQSAFKTEFGYSGPITAAAIADAYKGEVTNVINKGHITDTGSEKVAHTLDPTRQSPQQLDDVLSAYQALANSKMKMLDQQKERANQLAQPTRKTGGTTTPPAAAPKGDYAPGFTAF